MAVDFFQTTGELRTYVADIDASANVEQFEPHMRPARKKLLNTIGASTYSMLKTHYNDVYPSTETHKDAAVKYIQGALANFMARPYFIFAAKGRNEGENKLYRYQEDQILEMYLENAWTEMNNLIEVLENNPTVFTEFAKTDKYKDRQKLFIKSAYQFHTHYPIDNSAYFYNNIVYILKETQFDIKTRHSKFPDSLSEIDDDTQWIIGKALCFEAMARACRRMDFTELPRGIRHEMYKEINNKARLNTYQESYIRENLYNYLHQESEKWLDKLEFEANKDRNDGDFIEPSDDDPITEDDNFYIPGF